MADKSKVVQKNKFWYADKLIQLTKHYGFDGWLINIETPVHDALALRDWVQYLTKEIKNHISHAVIIIYDSIIPNG